MGNRGLTLIETLVVLAIVGGLLGLSVPAVQGVMRFAVGTRCCSNLRQIGMAALTYAEDWNGQLPAKSNFGVDDPRRSPAWFDRLTEYVDLTDIGRRTSVFQCAGFHGAPSTVFTHAMPKSLKMNSYLDAGGRPRHYALGTAGDESTVALFVDAVAKETGMGQWGYAPRSAVDDSRHRGRINILCLDGHALTTVAPATGEGVERGANVKWLSDGWK
jgi:prepilin-type N-terminal cleavage/methylation domain-containing protein/prepilin-type processing-associated H-X9-DG protein